MSSFLQDPNTRPSFLSILGRGLDQINGANNQRMEEQYMGDIFAANPDFAQKLYGAKNNAALLQLEQARTAQAQQALDLKRQQSMQLGGIPVDAPSAIQEYLYYSQLPPEAQAQYLNVKRSNQIVNLGGSQAVVNPTGQISQQYQVTPKPEDMPDFKGNVVTAQETAKNEAEKLANAPKVNAMVDANVKVINEALAHPGLDANFGKMGVLPNIPGGAAADARSYLDQIKGTAFLTAVAEMKGSGALSDAEGKAATAAVARLNSAQSPESARKALSDLKAALEGAKTRANQGLGSNQKTGNSPRIVITKSIGGKTYGQDEQGNWYEQ